MSRFSKLGYPLLVIAGFLVSSPSMANGNTAVRFIDQLPVVAPAEVEPGRYTTHSRYCDYIVEILPGKLLLEGAHSEDLTCGRAGEVVIRPIVNEGEALYRSQPEDPDSQGWFEYRFYRSDRFLIEAYEGGAQEPYQQVIFRKVSDN